MSVMNASAASTKLSNAPLLPLLPPVRCEFSVDATSRLAWRVRCLVLREPLSEPYEATLGLSLAHAQVWAAAADFVDSSPADRVRDAMAALLGRSACVVLQREGREKRFVCGVVDRVEEEGWLGPDYRLKVRVVPALALLRQQQVSRIFQDLSVPQILVEVLGPALLPYGRSLVSALRRDYVTREYCVQHRESTFAFVRRLMAQEGIAFYFDHDERDNAERLVLVDHNDAYPAHRGHAVVGAALNGVAARTQDPSVRPIAIASRDEARLCEEFVSVWRSSTELRPTHVWVHQPDWTRPRLLVGKGLGWPDAQDRARVVEWSCAGARLAAYQPATRAYAVDDTIDAARVALHQARRGEREVAAASNVMALQPGRLVSFELPDATCSGNGEPFLITGVEHVLQCPGSPEVGSPEVGHQGRGTAGVCLSYENRFTCVPHAEPFVPPPPEPAPAAGLQTATVVGPVGEEIFVDEHGRVKVQFHWDLVGSRNAHSSCWVRVAQPWAGTGFGVAFLPRVGMEVLVGFVDADPDRPVICGGLHNGDNVSPLRLPADKHKSIIRTRSSPAPDGDGGGQSIAFDDTAGHESLALAAHRDLQMSAGHDWRSRIGGNAETRVRQRARLIVGGDHVVEVEGGQSIDVHGDAASSVGGKERRRVAGGQEVAVRGLCETTIEGDRRERTTGASDVHVGANKTVRIDGEHELRVGSYARFTVGAAARAKVDGRLDVKARDAIELRAADSITLRVGKHMLVIDAQRGIRLGSAAQITLAATDKIALRGRRITQN